MSNFNNEALVRKFNRTSFLNSHNNSGIVVSTVPGFLKGNFDIKEILLNTKSTVSNGIKIEKNELYVKNKKQNILPLIFGEIYTLESQITIKNNTYSFFDSNTLNVKNNQTNDFSKLNYFLKIDTGESKVIKFNLDNIVESSGLSLVTKFIENPQIMANLNLSEVSQEIKYCFNESFNIDTDSIYIKEKNNKNTFVLEDPLIFTKNQCIVKTSLPPSMNNSGGSGTFKELILHFQKMAYIELDLKFETEVITEILSLPEGLEFKNNRLCGSLVNSGVYKVSFVFQSGKKVDGIIVCPELERIF